MIGTSTPLKRNFAAYCCTIAVIETLNAITLLMLHQYTIPINTTEICLDTLNVDIQGPHLLCGDFNAHNPA